MVRDLPTPPFLACRNHPTIGQLLSHKRRKFGSCPQHEALQPEKGVCFVAPRYNRPRRRQDLAKNLSTITLRPRDLSCSNPRCLVCPLLRRPTFLASTSNQTTHPVEKGLHCLSRGVVYVMTCRHCGKQYVGETGQTVRQRFARHRLKMPTAPMTLYSHFLRFHHVDRLEVDLVLV